MLATGITLRYRIMSASAEKDHLPQERQWNIGGDEPSVRVCHSRFRQSFTKRSLHRTRKIDSCDIFPRYWTLDCLLLGYLSTVPRLVLLPQYERVWMKQQQQKKNWGKAGKFVSISALYFKCFWWFVITRALYSKKPWRLFFFFACLCDSTAPVSRLCDRNLVRDQLNRRDRHVFLSPGGGNHCKELTRAEISEQSSATGNLSVMGVKERKMSWKKRKDFAGSASRMRNGCRRTEREGNSQVFKLGCLRLSGK